FPRPQRRCFPKEAAAKLQPFFILASFFEKNFLEVFFLKNHAVCERTSALKSAPSTRALIP
ncbi:hypothetical protein, partial [Robertkochia sediminum]|uniref:hypothetical protein n=1 Tax=Robertkochia sediminum TaxID=2785326 RepID=UPI001F262792